MNFSECSGILDSDDDVKVALGKMLGKEKALGKELEWALEWVLA